MLGRDKTKTDTYMVKVLLKMFKRGQLNKNHPLQRHADRWQITAKSGLVSTIIKGEDLDSLKICEQILNKTDFILWLIDGLQRLTALEEYRNGAFRISKSLEMPFVYYQQCINGEMKVVEYDLRGKWFKDLPEELQDAFDSYPINVVKHLDCTDEEIAYHMARYNRQTSMNAEEKSILPMSNIATYIKDTINNNFFKNCGDYGEAALKNGKLNRVVYEAITIMFHAEEYTRGKSLFKHLNENTSKEEFDTLNNELDMLASIVDEETGKLFNVKNSFLFFSLFHKFLDYKIEPARFNDFLLEFKNNLHNKTFSEYEDKTFDTYDKDKNSKDKKVVFAKLDMLEKLMKEYFQEEISEPSREYTNEEIEQFVTDVTSVEVDEDRMELFSSMLDDYTVEVDNSSKLLEKENRLSLLSLVAYSFEKEIELKDWFIDYFNKNNTYIKDQKENYLVMKNDVDNFVAM